MTAPEKAESGAPPAPAPRPVRRRFRGRGARVALAVAVVLLCLLAAEIGLRAVEAIGARRLAARAAAGDPEARKVIDFFAGSLPIHRPSRDRRLLYELTPGGEAVRDGVAIRINADGARDDPFPDPIPPDAPRVVVVGDSVAWGWGVEMHEAFPQALERLLADDAAASETASPPIVFNLAVDGYSTDQELALLETRGLALDPDLVILSYVLNDPDNDDGGLAHHFSRPGLRLARPLRDLVWRATRPDNKARAGGAGRDYFQYVHERYWSRVDAQFERLGAFARRIAPARVLVAVSPILNFEPGGVYHWEYLHDHLRELCERHGLDYLDLRSALEGVPSREVCLWIDAPQEPTGRFPDVLHPDARGHELYAKALAERIRNDRLLHRPRPRP